MLRHQADIKEDTIARPVCLLKRARVGALSEGNMVEATHLMRKVQPFRVDCTLCPIARPVCLLKRARVGALSEGNMVEATHLMRKVKPFRVDCTLCRIKQMLVLKNG